MKLARLYLTRRDWENLRPVLADLRAAAGVPPLAADRAASAVEAMLRQAPVGVGAADASGSGGGSSPMKSAPATPAIGFGSSAEDKSKATQVCEGVMMKSLRTHARHACGYALFSAPCHVADHLIPCHSKYSPIHFT